MAPVFVVDSGDCASFVKSFMYAFANVLRTKFGSRASTTLECTNTSRMYEISVLSYVVVTFQVDMRVSYGSTLTSYVQMPSVDGEGVYICNVRLFPYGTWLSLFHEYVQTANGGMASLFANAFAELASMSTHDRPSSVSIQTQTSVKTPILECSGPVNDVCIKPYRHKDIENLSVRLKKAKDTSERQENEIDNLKKRVKAAFVPPPAPSPPPLSPAILPSPPPVILPPTPRAKSSSLESVSAPQPNIDKRLKNIQRSIYTYLRNLDGGASKKKPARTKPIPGHPPIEKMQAYIKEAGLPIFPSMHSIMCRLGSLSQSLQDLEKSDDGIGGVSIDAATNLYFTPTKEQDCHTRSHIFSLAYRVLLSSSPETEPHVDKLSPGFLKVAALIRGQIGQVLPPLRECFSPTMTKIDIFETVIRSAMVTSITLFTQFMNDPVLSERAVQYHIRNATTLGGFCHQFSNVLDFATESAIEYAERNGLQFLNNALSRVIGFKNTPDTCFAMAALVESLPVTIQVYNDVHRFLSWIAESCTNDCTTAYTGGNIVAFPDILRCVSESPLK